MSSNFQDKIYQRQSFFRKIVCVEDVLAEKFIRLLEDPDLYLQDSQTLVLQENFKSKIGVVRVNSKKVVIKCHKYKSFWQRIKRYFRRTKASRSWHYSRILEAEGVDVPKPLAYVEERKGPLRGMAYFFYEYVDGITAEEYFKKYEGHPEKIENAIDVIVTLVRKIRDMGLIHGDVRVANLIFKDDVLYLIDFDDMRPRSWFKPARTRNRDVRGLIKDINFNLKPGVGKLFLAELEKL